ncbi:hypothetical protein [Rubripirellula reticaptiva]|uniref:Uncharacterized protein n=1 Tax=Rubripirellula reticaptiva TaxID=2528013 RepID=A0A5C6EKB7_9BACT|nr:hypothetical protein [Rubripirellula reticaptiva]TWU48061.1 hypothetical protein Poly59_49060 [Rubripirellula reticaptiva]
MNKFILAMLIAVVVPSIAEAGGGNTKAKAAFKFVNTTTSTSEAGRDVYVIVGTTEFLQATTQSNFTSRGGKMIPPGGSVTIGNLKAGLQTYAFAHVNAGSNPPEQAAFTSNVKTVKLAAGETRTVNLP